MLNKRRKDLISFASVSVSSSVSPSRFLIEFSESLSLIISQLIDLLDLLDTLDWSDGLDLIHVLHFLQTLHLLNALYSILFFSIPLGSIIIIFSIGVSFCHLLRIISRFRLQISCLKFLNHLIYLLHYKPFCQLQAPISTKYQNYFTMSSIN